ncbi:MAG TPA: DUF262 domain-containing protein [Rheinheimera sp.]|uniref:DUF262 domain-containing protein n=1 Tax=Rheinheimera sp. TaxID=1869214 RepID=UPI000EDC4AA9|nr:DUF262 domain-containing protein [Rheinheimera sp.]HCU64120.1 DUF262 domain-containing protein [Rheinheimera sp.]
MIDYRVRSVSLLNLVNDIRNGRLIPDAYFQRNLVWREIHKIDFIKTILLGLPFPQIFISKGKVNVETMSTVSCIVDGQQRSNAIIEFIDDVFAVDGKLYSDLDGNKKSDFLKYEVAVIELDLENDDPKVKEIFQRINRTSNSLTSIEKMASEFSTSYYMLVAKFLSDQIDVDKANLDDFKEDPNIPDDFYDWAKKKKIPKFTQLITRKNVFTPREISRKVHLMHVLNIMSSVLVGFYNRNEKTLENLNDYADVFDEKDEIVAVLEAAADIILKLRLKPKSYFLNKANMFSLTVSIANFIRDGNGIDTEILGRELERFELEIPEDYKLSAAEAVNSTRARQLRNNYISAIVQRAKII